MSQVQFGLILPISSADLPREVFLHKIRQALETAKGHFASAWVADHLQFGSRPLLDGWTLLAFLTAWCPGLDYGHLVLCQLFRNPALVAKMAATFQYMSQGHFIFGFGAGWAEEEARAYNLPFPAPGPRVSELDEQLQIIKAMWREDDVTFEGTYHKVTHVHCLPHPDPLPPLLVAAHQPRMMRVAARHADWWNTGVENLEKATQALAALDAACEAVGRDPQTLRRTAMISCACAANEQQLQAILASHKAPVPSFQGTPAQLVEQLQPLVEAGIDYFMVASAGMPEDLTTLELLAHEVLPALNR